jgi:hypothetical protein
MVKKKRQKYIRIVRTKGNKWTFKTWMGVVIASFFISLACFSFGVTGNAIQNSTRLKFGAEAFGMAFFIIGLFAARYAIKNRKNLE